jgi:hypothetical protein
MTFLAQAWLTVILLVSSVWASALDVLHLVSGDTASTTGVAVQQTPVVPAGADPSTYVAFFDTNGPVGHPMDSEAAFETIGKDKNSVYLGSSVVAGIDAKTFEYVGKDSLYFKDSSHVYLYSRRAGEIDVVDGADPGSFECVGDCSYAKDRKAVYYGFYIVEGADPATFHAISDPNLFDGAQDKSHTYAQGRMVR